MVKSAFAVFLCFLIYFATGKNGIPFYSAIAAILCMQPDASDSYKTALNRCIGTLIGGCYGTLLLFILKYTISSTDSLLYYFIISVAIIPLMYITILMRKRAATYITTVVFLSITVSHRSDLVPLVFGLSRIIETLIGILVSVVVNHLHIPRRKNHNVLFISDLNGTLLNSEHQLSSLTKVKLNHLISDGAKISVATSRTPASIVPLLKDVNFQLPIIVMNGAALYDMKEKKYIYVKNFNKADRDELFQLFHKNNVSPFAYSMFEDILHIYYSRLDNPSQQRYYDNRKSFALKAFIKKYPDEESPIMYFALYESYEIVQRVFKELTALPNADRFDVVYYKSVQDSDYYVLTVCRGDASKGLGVLELQERIKAEEIVVFGDDNNDISMLEVTSHSYAVDNSSQKIKKFANHIIDVNDSDSVIKTIQKLFFSSKVFSQVKKENKNL